LNDLESIEFLAAHRGQALHGCAVQMTEKGPFLLGAMGPFLYSLYNLCRVQLQMSLGSAI
jgi:hypothetical protein